MNDVLVSQNGYKLYGIHAPTFVNGDSNGHQLRYLKPFDAILQVRYIDIADIMRDFRTVYGHVIMFKVSKNS